MMTTIPYLSLCLAWLGITSSQPIQYTSSTFAGLRGSSGFANGQGTSANFSSPSSLAINSDGFLLVADTLFHRIRFITTPAAVVTTLAGSGNPVWADGIGTDASFSFPQGVVTAPAGCYIADSGTNRIRLISPVGVVTTIGGNGISNSTDAIGTEASFALPTGLALSPDGLTLYVTDFMSGRLRSITIATTAVTTIATSFLFASPAGLAMSPSNTLFIAEAGNSSSSVNGSRILTISPPGGDVSVFAGAGFPVPGVTPPFSDGLGSAATFNGPFGISLDTSGTLFVCDVGNNIIRSISPTGLVTTVAGSNTSATTSSDGVGSSATFDQPRGIVTAVAGGGVYVAESGVANSVIRLLSPTILPPSTTPSGTLSPTITPSPSPTDSPTVSPSPTESSSPTPSEGASPSSTPTTSPTPTMSPSPPPTPSPTTTPTPPGGGGGGPAAAATSGVGDVPALTAPVVICVLLFVGGLGAGVYFGLRSDAGGRGGGGGGGGGGSVMAPGLKSALAVMQNKNGDTVAHNPLNNARAGV